MNARFLEERLRVSMDYAYDSDTGEYVDSSLAENVIDEQGIVNMQLNDLVYRMACDVIEYYPCKIPFKLMQEYEREIKEDGLS